MCIAEYWRTPTENLDAIVFWSPRVTRWLDETRVKGNSDAERMARVIRRLWGRAGDLLKLQHPEKYGLAMAANVLKRVRGLTA